jgi:ribosomal protein L11 methyltransferase
MRELTLRVPAEEAERVLDTVLPALPGGLHLREDGDTVELKILDTPGTPAEEELRALVGSRLLGSGAAEVSDDWRERRSSRYEPLVIADRFLVRPDWAPPADRPGLVEIILEQSSAFGTGVHPTTQACLATLAEVEPGGSFADYGSGSGVLSIAAERLGWAPVVAVDVSEPTVAAARRNAERNRAPIDIRHLDLTAETPPAANTIVANVPPQIHAALTQRLEQRPALAIVSGFHPEEIDSVAATWEARGLSVEDEARANEWVALLLR